MINYSLSSSSHGSTPEREPRSVRRSGDGGLRGRGKRGMRGPVNLRRSEETFPSVKKEREEDVLNESKILSELETSRFSFAQSEADLPNRDSRAGTKDEEEEKHNKVDSL